MTLCWRRGRIDPGCRKSMTHLNFGKRKPNAAFRGKTWVSQSRRNGSIRRRRQQPTSQGVVLASSSLRSISATFSFPTDNRCSSNSAPESNRNNDLFSDQRFQILLPPDSVVQERDKSIFARYNRFRCGLICCCHQITTLPLRKSALNAAMRATHFSKTGLITFSAISCRLFPSNTAPISYFSTISAR